VYATKLNGEENEVLREVSNAIVSESDDEWKMSDETEENECEDTGSNNSYMHEEERQNVTDNDELSDYIEKHDVITREDSDEDKVPIYFDRGMKGEIFVHESDGKVKLDVGLLFLDVDDFRAALRDFVIQEGFEIRRIKNEKG
jgi:hypothetical protein